MPHHILNFIHDENPAFSDDLYEQAKRCLLDTLGVAAAAKTTEPSRILSNHIRRQYGPTDDSRAKLLFRDQYASECGAAFYGAGSIDSLDAHDGQVLTKGHIGVVVMPTLFAIPEINDLSAKQLLDAIIIGYEIGTRAGIALHATSCDYHTSGAWNALVSAALVARLKKLSPDQTLEALGLAEYHGPRSQMMRCIDNPIMAKDGSAWGALAGYSAALLAMDGFTGAPAVTLFEDQVKEIWSDLGQRFYIHEQYIKAYPVCRWAQPAIEAVLTLTHAHEIDLDQIKHIDVYSFHEAKRLSTPRPKNSDQAQYSLPFSVACALRDGTVNTKAITDELEDPLLLSLSHRVRTFELEKYCDLFPAERWAHVIIEMNNGEKYQSEPSIARGNPENPLTNEQIKDKFFDLSTISLSQDQSQKLYDTISNIEKLSSLKPLLELI